MGDTRSRVTRQVLAGIEVACWDALGRTVGLPVYTFLGGQVHDHLEFYGYVQGSNVEELQQSASDLVKDGFSILYMKVNQNLPANVRGVTAVRDVAGPERLVRVDANEAWSMPEAIDDVRALEEFDIDWVEQPTSLHDISALREVRRSVSTKVAADQSIFSVGELRHVLEERAADVVVLGQHETGGLWGLRQMAYLTEAHSVPLNRHASFETGISTYAALQVLASIPVLAPGHQLMHQLLEYDITAGDRLAHRCGVIGVPDDPGLGFELDPDAVEASRERYRAQGPYAAAQWADEMSQETPNP